MKSSHSKSFFIASSLYKSHDKSIMIVLDCMPQECARKESEYASNAALFKEKYQSVCKQMSIKVRVLIYHSIHVQWRSRSMYTVGNSIVQCSHRFDYYTIHADNTCSLQLMLNMCHRQVFQQLCEVLIKFHVTIIVTW